MDAVGLTTLESEMREDFRVMTECVQTAENRYAQPHPAGLEAAAHYLHRFYNAFEQSGLRLARAFENHIDADAGWHFHVLQRLTLDIPGVRPAFLPHHLKQPLDRLRGFRHIIVHAYDLTLDPDLVELRIQDAQRVLDSLPEIRNTFFDTVRRELEE